ncbi:hypothetical protein QIH01_07105 [Brevibacillus brevis]|nr:hypothetical protein QIH01_07105 [Brevibacillus brevis]
MSDYLNFLSKYPEEIPAGLLTIMEAASKYDIAIEDILEQYAGEIDRFSEYNNPVNIGRHYNFRYHKIVYELKKGRIPNALEEILCCLDLADQLKDHEAFKRCTSLFWEHRQHASEQHERVFQKIIGRFAE